MKPVTEWECFKQVADVIGHDAAVKELELVPEEALTDSDLCKKVSQAFRWSYTPQGLDFWRAINRGKLPPGYPAPSEKTTVKSDEPAHTKNKYTVECRGRYIDVYDVLKAFGVTNPADQHAIKKMLMPGKRGTKDAIKDRKEAIESIKRAIELEE